MTRDQRLERLAAALDASAGSSLPTAPAPRPPIEARPKRIAVTDLDRLKADPFAFYAKAILGLAQARAGRCRASRRVEGHRGPRGARGLVQGGRLRPRQADGPGRAMIADEAIHPMLRALWSPRLMEAVDWIAAESSAATGRPGAAVVAEEWRGRGRRGHALRQGRPDRPAGRRQARDRRLQDRPGARPRRRSRKASRCSSACSSLIARGGGFDGIEGEAGAHEYWSLAKKKGRIGYRSVTGRRRTARRRSSTAPMPISPRRPRNGCWATSRSRPSSTRPTRLMRIMTS